MDKSAEASGGSDLQQVGATQSVGAINEINILLF
jgi:hypothetical protein